MPYFSLLPQLATIINLAQTARRTVFLRMRADNPLCRQYNPLETPLREDP